MVEADAAPMIHDERRVPFAFTANTVDCDDANRPCQRCRHDDDECTRAQLDRAQLGHMTRALTAAPLRLLG